MEAGIISMAINYHLQDQFLDKFFSEIFANDFYLTGGTALSRFYFGHRESIDLDLFTHKQKLDFSAVNLLVGKITHDMNLRTIKQVVTNTFLQFILEDNMGSGLKLDLVKDIPVHFGKLRKKGKIQIDSLENIGSNKVLAVFGRTDQKDFLDLYYILHNTKFTFEYLVSLAKKKDLGLTEFYLANSINQLENATQMPRLLKPIDKAAYKKFFRELSRNLLLSVKPNK